MLANPHVKVMLELDTKNGNRQYQAKIEDMAISLLTENKSLMETITGHCKQFVDGVLSEKGKTSSKGWVKFLSSVNSTVNRARTVAEILTFVPQFIEELDREINSLARSDKELTKHKDSDDKKGDETHSSVEDEIVFEDPTEKPSDTSEKSIEDSLGNDKIKKDEVMARKKIPNYTTDTVLSKISDLVSENMTNLLNNKIITPLSRTAVSHGVHHLTKDITRAHQDAIGHYQGLRRIMFSQDEKAVRLPSSYKKQLEHDNLAKEKASEIIKDLKEGGEAGLYHMGAISDEISRPLHVYNKKGTLIMVIGEKKSGQPVKVRYEEPDHSNPRGHYTTLTKDPATGCYQSAAASGPRSCLFDVVAQQLPAEHPLRGDGQRLRDRVVQNMDTFDSHRKLTYTSHDILRLERCKKNALYRGGVKRLRDADKMHDYQIFYKRIIKEIINGKYPNISANSTDLQIFEFLNSLKENKWKFKIYKNGDVKNGNKINEAIRSMPFMDELIGTSCFPQLVLYDIRNPSSDPDYTRIDAQDSLRAPTTSVVFHSKGHVTGGHPGAVINCNTKNCKKRYHSWNDGHN